MTTKCRVRLGMHSLAPHAFRHSKLLRVKECLIVLQSYIVSTLKTAQKQNKTKHSRLHHYKNVTIRYRYKLFAHKLARVGNLGSGSVAKCHSNSKRHGLRLPLIGLKL